MRHEEHTPPKKHVIEKIPLQARHVLAVASGKGGVGKSTVTVNLALALAKRNLKVGLLDADVYGPNVPLMLGIEKQAAETRDNMILPVEKHGIKVMSVAFLCDEEKALIWRGPLANQLIEQFLGMVDWGQLDVLLIDLPPGTGDVPLAIIQKAPLSGGIVVSTLQEAAVADVRKMINMFQTTETNILGIVENMTHIACAACGETIPLYPGAVQKKLSETLGYERLAEFPYETGIAHKSEEGTPFLLREQNREHPLVKAYDALAEKVLSLQETEA